MKKILATLQRYSKFLAAIVGAVTEAINLGYLPHNAQNGVSIAVSILTALGVVGVSNGPAMADGTALANDLASLKDKIGPLPETGGIKSVVEWLANEARKHGADLVAIVEAGKTSIEDLIHQKPAVTVAAEPNTSTTMAEVTVHEPTADPTEPEDPELTKLKATIGQ